MVRVTPEATVTSQVAVYGLPQLPQTVFVLIVPQTEVPPEGVGVGVFVGVAVAVAVLVGVGVRVGVLVGVIVGVGVLVGV